MKYNTLETYEKAKKGSKDRDNLKHIHRFGEHGSSGSGGCPVLEGMKDGGMKVPEKNEVQEDVGAMQMGTITHKDVGLTVFDSFNRDPKNKAENIEYWPEVYMSGELFEGFKVFTPVDNMYIKKKDKNTPAIIKKNHKFKKSIEEVNVLHPESTIVDIGDTKTTTMYGLNHHQEDLPWGYKCQFEVNMKLCGKEELEALIIEKSKFKKARVIYKHNPLVYNEMIERMKLRKNLAIKVKNKEFKNLKEIQDFIKEEPRYCNCLDWKNQPFSWWSCTYSPNEVERKYDGSLTQKRTGLCVFAKQFLAELIPKRFKVGQILRRPNEKQCFVIISDISEGKVFSYKLYKKEPQKPKQYEEDFEQTWINCQEIEGDEQYLLDLMEMGKITQEEIETSVKK